MVDYYIRKEVEAKTKIPILYGRYVILGIFVWSLPVASIELFGTLFLSAAILMINPFFAPRMKFSTFEKQSVKRINNVG